MKVNKLIVLAAGCFLLVGFITISCWVLIVSFWSGGSILQPPDDIEPTPSQQDVRNLLNIEDFPSEGWGHNINWPIEEQGGYLPADAVYSMSFMGGERIDAPTPFYLKLYHFRYEGQAASFFAGNEAHHFRTDLSVYLSENYEPTEISINVNAARQYRFACVLHRDWQEKCRFYAQYDNCIVYLSTDITAAMTYDDLKRILENSLDVNMEDLDTCTIN